jgi:hypothetical protein
MEKAPAAAQKRNGLKKGPSKGNPIKVYNGVPVCDLEGGWPGGWRQDGDVPAVDWCKRLLLV